MLRHIWIQDKVDWEEVARFYNHIKCTVLQSRVGIITVYYKGIPVEVRFYNKEQADNHLKHRLWCGMHIQKVVCFENIKLDCARYLITRFRSDTKPQRGSSYTPKGVVCVMESTEEVYFSLRGDRDIIYTFDNDISSESLLEALHEFF